MPEDEPVVIRRIYPANVVLPDGTEVRQALAIVTRRRVYVWGPVGGGVTSLLDETYVPPDRPIPHVSQLRSAPLILDVADGEGKVHITQGSGCGCGSALKTFRPFAADVTGPSS